MPVKLEIADPKTADAAMRSIALAMAADLVDAGVNLDDDAKVALALIERRWTSPVIARVMDAAVAAAKAAGGEAPKPHKADYGPAAVKLLGSAIEMMRQPVRAL